MNDRDVTFLIAIYLVSYNLRTAELNGFNYAISLCIRDTSNTPVVLAKS